MRSPALAVGVAFAALVAGLVVVRHHVPATAAQRPRVADESAPFPGRTGSGRTFPDTSARIAILTDQLPGDMTDAQQQFAARHYVGTQKLTRNLSRPLRAINPNFLVLHYHLAMWQSAPHVNFIVNGTDWRNDFAQVTPHEDWFWHNRQGQRVASSQDGKLLMNVSNPGFQAYWRESLAEQVRAGDYDGVFLDSASPALLQWEARAPIDDRLLRTGARTNQFAELGGRSWIAAWEEWIARLSSALASEGIPLIPNAGALATTWDDTDYSLASGVFSEGFCDPGYVTADWKDSVNQLLRFVRKNRIVILQNYLTSHDDLARRRYLLANYLLVKGERTYLSYYWSRPFAWYPEWTLDLGPALRSGTTVDDLFAGGVYRRDFAKGLVLVNPGTTAVAVDLGATFKRVEPEGGGAVPADGVVAGRIMTTPVARLVLPPKSAEILLR